MTSQTPWRRGHARKGPLSRFSLLAALTDGLPALTDGLGALADGLPGASP
ncbi:hypothetical protein [Streptomyces thioluteus]